MADRDPIPGVTPSDPAEEGVPMRELSIEEVEPALMLANDVREEMLGAGFTEEEIVGWARAYVAETGEATTAEGLIDWIRSRER